MKSVFITLLIGLALSACARTDTRIDLPDDPDWIRLEAPQDGEAMDIAGAIDSTLFVATAYHIYKTSNQGKTWESVWSGSQGVFGVIVQKDTIFIMRARSNNPSHQQYAVVSPSDYSTDGGKTWHTYQDRFQLKRQVSPVSTAPDITYSIKVNIASDGYVNPSDIIRWVGNGQRVIRFPFKHDINSLHLDAKNRLYVAVSGTWVPETDRIYCCSRELPSVVYVSRKSLPE